MSRIKVAFIQEQLEFALVETKRVAEAVPVEARLYQPGEGRPTVLWLLGHLGNTMNSVVIRWCLGAEHAFPKDLMRFFAPDFAGGEPPCSDASKYPPFEDVVKLYETAMRAAISGLDALNDEDLDRELSTKLPEPIRAFFPTVGKSLQRMISHDGYHRGQMGLLGKLAQ